MLRLDFLFKNLKGGDILDIGNLDKGGHIHKMLMRKFPGSVFYGQDVVNQRDIDLDFINQKIGSAEKIEFPDESFDTVYMGQILEHVWNPKQAIRECFRVLKKNGVLVLDTPNVYSLSRMLRYIVCGRDIILGNPEHKIFYSAAMIENLLRSSGFKDITIETENVFALKSRLWPIPSIGIFKQLGECLMAAGIK